MPTRRVFLFGALSLALPREAHAAAPVVVGSKLDLEGALIGHMILFALNNAGIPTQNRLQIGPTTIARAALLAGAIDICIEYTGNAAFFFHDDTNPVWKSAEAGYARAKKLDFETNRLVWLQPAPADNTWVIAIPQPLASKESLRTLEDFARFIRDGKRVRLAASAEFVESAAGLPAFEETYGFKLRASQLLILSGGETSATMKAAADGISGVNAGMAYGTDGALAALDLIALEDTKHAEPVYAPAPVVRAEVLDAYPSIAQVLAPVFMRLDLVTLRKLNEKVAVEGEDAGAVARNFLQTSNLLE